MAVAGFVTTSARLAVHTVEGGEAVGVGVGEIGGAALGGVALIIAGALATLVGGDAGLATNQAFIAIGVEGAGFGVVPTNAQHADEAKGAVSVDDTLSVGLRGHGDLVRTRGPESGDKDGGSEGRPGSRRKDAVQHNGPRPGDRCGGPRDHLG